MSGLAGRWGGATPARPKIAAESRECNPIYACASGLCVRIGADYLRVCLEMRKDVPRRFHAYVVSVSIGRISILKFLP